MKKTKFMTLVMCLTLVFSGCSTKAGTGAILGTGAGAVLGAIVGKIAGNTAVGAAVGVQTVTDANGLNAVKVTFDSGILFDTNKYALKASSKNELANFANVLNNNTDCSVAVQGYTDSTGSDKVNNPLSQNRANAVANYLRSCGVSNNQLRSVQGFGSSNPVADNSTAAGRQQNRRVEVILYPSEAMIQAAQNGTLK